jgi:hypothetical protein
MSNKKIKWADDVIDPIIKRSCECQCCLGCGRNSLCNKFGPHFCNNSDEWRCNLCYNVAKLSCNYCLRDITSIIVVDSSTSIVPTSK